MKKILSLILMLSTTPLFAKMDNKKDVILCEKNLAACEAMLKEKLTFEKTTYDIPKALRNKNAKETHYSKFVVKFDNGKSRNFAPLPRACFNINDTNNCKKINILAIYPKLNRVLIESEYYELNNSVFLHLGDGKSLDLEKIPVFSPNKSLMVDVNCNEGNETVHDFALFDITASPIKTLLKFKRVDNFCPDFEAWEGNDAIKLKSRHENNKIVYVRKQGNEWKLVR